MKNCLREGREECRIDHLLSLVKDERRKGELVSGNLSKRNIALWGNSCGGFPLNKILFGSRLLGASLDCILMDGFFFWARIS